MPLTSVRHFVSRLRHHSIRKRGVTCPAGLTTRVIPHHPFLITRAQNVFLFLFFFFYLRKANKYKERRLYPTTSQTPRPWLSRGTGNEINCGPLAQLFLLGKFNKVEGRDGNLFAAILSNANLPWSVCWEHGWHWERACGPGCVTTPARLFWWVDKFLESPQQRSLELR